MDDYPNQLPSQHWGADEPLSQECVYESHDVEETLKERLLEARYCAEEERTMKMLDSSLNHVLFAAVAITFINKFATMQPNFRLYPFHTTLVAGLHEIFHAIQNGMFTRGTFLSVFAAPSFTLWAVQGMIDACLFVSPLVVVVSIFGKWVLGHFIASTDEDGHAQTRRRPLQDWPKHVRARVLSWLEALNTILALSEILYAMCCTTARNPFAGICIAAGVTILCIPVLYMFYRLKSELQ